MECNTAADERECVSSAAASTTPCDESASPDSPNIDAIASAFMALSSIKSEHYRPNQFFAPLGFPTSSFVQLAPPANSKVLTRFQCSKTFGREYFDARLSASSFSLALRIVAEAPRKRDAE